ncbi:HpcH/HpaI aldolase/citrate lyase family protein [Pikeienuella piscinae]|uniref:Hydroxypyruvate/pyruvate aldolase n=1 Tax=Pikeienuella piscinae TaxID=2748098 RepID=A0A7L5BX61_9RHOB|nr:HpcH/HpaI aldolase/citrate lyase family protein [Pikeienuella piscinae]QIE54836.1 HpcH/HpaI aldolase/citrate lyase family protein [Pikeienuella piscinae]
MNRFKDRLKTGEPLYGIFLGLAHPLTSEVSASAGFDWLLIDGEHAPNDLATIVAQVNALAPHDVDVFVRIRDRDPRHLKQLLDVGVRNFLVPVVDTAEQAAALAAATRYPPEGNRGVGMLGARATNFGRNPGYLADANRDICLLVQIETRTGLSNMDAIMDVDGVDGVFFGPADLSADFGHIGNPGQADVKATILDAIARARKAGKAAGVMTLDDSLIQAYRDAGANFLSIGLDTNLLAKAVDALAKKWKS